jgi:hypothetical protein
MHLVDGIHAPGTGVGSRTRSRALSVTASAAMFFLCTLVAGCSSDVGVDSHAVRVALIDGAVARVAALECYAIDQAPDLHGSDHGTAMASVVLDAIDSPCEESQRIRLGSFPVLDDAGNGASPDAVAHALRLALNWDADLVNVSIDLREGSRELEAAVAEAEVRGVPVIAAAGNRMGLAAGYPAAYDSVIAVGASDAGGEPLWFSAGDGVDAYAPGTDVPALNAREEELSGEGTSFAAAVHTRTLAGAIP